MFAADVMKSYRQGIKKGRMIHDTAIIITQKKDKYKNYLDEDTKISNCMECGEEVVYGDITYRHAEEVKKNKKVKEQKIKFVCGDCFMKLPKFGKLIRPNKEMIEKLRADGHEMDEVSIRKMMHDIKHKKF